MATLPTQFPNPVPPPEWARTPLEPIYDQAAVLYTTVVFAFAIFAFWTVPVVILRSLLNPLKLFTIGWHELCHAGAGIFTGGSITKLTIDPYVGGCTLVEGGHQPTILFSGYIGSTLLGGLFILGGWDTLVAKILSFILGFGLLFPLSLVRDKLTIVLTFIYEALLIGFWFADHGSVLRWYCLFVGVMNVFYVVWDVADEKFLRKTNDSDITQFVHMFPSTSTAFWLCSWLVWIGVVIIWFSFLGLAFFKLSPQQMREQAAKFLPT